MGGLDHSSFLLLLLLLFVLFLPAMLIFLMIHGVKIKFLID